MTLARFRYSKTLAENFPGLCSLVVAATGITDDAMVDVAVERNLGIAKDNLDAVGNESQISPIKAWRAAYTATGTNPTKYRMAAESILRRIRTRNDFPKLHPLVNLCNSLSARFAIPVAALDVEYISGDLTVQEAEGDETYHGFDGSVVQLPKDEVTFKDAAGIAHARRWSHKQSKQSAVSGDTRRAVVFSEALHSEARPDLRQLEAILIEDIRGFWPDANIRHGLLEGAALHDGFDI